MTDKITTGNSPDDGPFLERSELGLFEKPAKPVVLTKATAKAKKTERAIDAKLDAKLDADEAVGVKTEAKAEEKTQLGSQKTK